jgi:hypothetical protein
VITGMLSAFIRFGLLIGKMLLNAVVLVGFVWYLVNRARIVYIKRFPK